MKYSETILVLVLDISVAVTHASDSRMALEGEVHVTFTKTLTSWTRLMRLSASVLAVSNRSLVWKQCNKINA